MNVSGWNLSRFDKRIKPLDAYGRASEAKCGLGGNREGERYGKPLHVHRKQVDDEFVSC